MYGVVKRPKLAMANFMCRILMFRNFSNEHSDSESGKQRGNDLKFKYISFLIFDDIEVARSYVNLFTIGGNCLHFKHEIQS